MKLIQNYFIEIDKDVYFACNYEINKEIFCNYEMSHCHSNFLSSNCFCFLCCWLIVSYNQLTFFRGTFHLKRCFVLQAVITSSIKQNSVIYTDLVNPHNTECNTSNFIFYIEVGTFCQI